MLFKDAGSYIRPYGFEIKEILFHNAMWIVPDILIILFLSSAGNRYFYCRDVSNLTIIRLHCLGTKPNWPNLVSKSIHSLYNNLRYIDCSGYALSSSFDYDCWLIC